MLNTIILSLHTVYRHHDKSNITSQWRHKKFADLNIKPRNFTSNYTVYWSQLTATIQCSLQPVSYDQFSIRVNKSTLNRRN